MSEHHRTAEWVRVRSVAKPRIAAQISAGLGVCIDCGRHIEAGTPLTHWQVGHRVSVSAAKAAGWTDAQVNAMSNLGPSHSKASGYSCNQRAGGRMGARAVNNKRAQKRREDKDLPNW